MRRFIKYTLIILATLTSFVACRNYDDEITPSGNYSPIGEKFPQGTTAEDSIIMKIKDDYGVYLLYKNITDANMNRTWISSGTGDIYVAGKPEDRIYNKWDLPQSHLKHYVNFFNDYIFPNITKEFAKSTFPVKIYMINNLRTEPRDYGEENKEENSNNSGTDADPNKIIKLGDFDNWAISFPDSTITILNKMGEDGALTTEDSEKAEYLMKQLRSVFIINVIKNSISKGELTAPEGFWDDYSMNRNSKCLTEKNHEGCDSVDVVNKESANGLYTLGYVDILEEKFGTGSSPAIWKNTNIRLGKHIHADYWNSTSQPTWNLFEAYIMNAMWLTPDSFHARYNTDVNTKIKTKYDLVVEHIKNFGVDLVGIANGKKEQEKAE